MKTLAIGIAIGGTRTKIGLVNLDTGQVEDMLITPTETKDDRRFLETIGEAISQFKAKAAEQQAVLRKIIRSPGKFSSTMRCPAGSTMTRGWKSGRVTMEIIGSHWL